VGAARPAAARPAGVAAGRGGLPGRVRGAAPAARLRPGAGPVARGPAGGRL